MRRPVMTVALLLMIWFLPVTAGAQDEVTAKLTFRVGKINRTPFISISPTKEPPAGVEVPEGMEDAWFVRRDFGEGRKLLIAARFHPEPVWIRVDRDFDGDLSNEEPFYFSGLGSGTTLEALVEVEVVLDPMGAPQKITLRFIHHQSKTSHCLHLAVPVHKEGEVVLGGRVRKIVLADGDHDLLFSTPGQDRLFLDVDGDTEVRATTSSHEEVIPGRPFRLGNAGWIADLAKNGDITFRRSKRAPDPSVMRWPRVGTPKAGRNPTGEVAPFVEQKREYLQAEDADNKAGANVTTSRSKVIANIGKTGERDAFRFLLHLADGDPNVNIRSSALRATGYKCYQPFAAAVLEIAGGSGHTSVRMAAFAALHGMDAPRREPLLLTVLKDTNEESLFGDAGRNLAYLGSEEGLRLLEKHAVEHPKENFRYQAYQVAARYRSTPPSEIMIISAAVSSHPRLRTMGLEHALMLGLPESLDLGAAALKDTDEKVRMAAVRLLATRDDPEAAAELFRAAGGLPTGAQTSMVKLLTPVRRPETIDLFCDRLATGSPPERTLAAEILSAIRTDQTTEVLLARLQKEKDARVLTAIIRALGVHRPPGADTKIVAAAERTRGDPVAFAAALDALAAFGLENPRVRRFFEKALRSRDFEVRVVAIDAAAKAGGGIGTDLLLLFIDDKAWQVRLTVVQGLGKVRVRRAVLPLIERLEVEEVPRIVAAIADALFRTTGQNFYDILELWKRWWLEHGETFEVPEKVPEIKPDDHGGRSVASFYGVPVETDRLIFVIDQSGSMSSASGNRTKLEVAVEQTLKVVKTLGKNARLNVILFETAIHSWQKHLVKVNAGTRGALRKHLESKRPMGGTNLYDGLEMALLTREVDTIYLLSDGAPGSGKFVKHEDILREVMKINRTRRIAIHCIAVGFDSSLMKELAAQNGGQYVRR